MKQQNKLTYIHGILVNIYIVYELRASSSFNGDLALRSFLSDAVKLTKNADIDEYHYSGYGIRFDRKESFSFQLVGLVEI